MGIFARRNLNPKMVGKLKDEEDELEAKLQKIREERTKVKEESGMTEDDERILEAMEIVTKFCRGEKSRIENILITATEIKKKLDEMEPIVEFLSKTVEKNKL